MFLNGYKLIKFFGASQKWRYRVSGGHWRALENAKTEYHSNAQIHLANAYRAHKGKCRKLFVFYITVMCLSFPLSLTSIQYRSVFLKDCVWIHTVSVTEVEMVKIWSSFHITDSIITALQLEQLFHLRSINYWLTAIIYESLKSVRRFGLFCLHYENVLSDNLKNVLSVEASKFTGFIQVKYII